MSGFVAKNPNSKFYQAFFPVWDDSRQEWVRASKSTKCVDREQAEDVMRDFAHTAQVASKFPKGTRLTKDYVEAVVLGILSTAGIDVGAFTRPKMPILEYFDRYIDGMERKVSKASMRAYRSYYKLLREWLVEEGAGDRDLEWFSLAGCEDLYVELLSRMTPKSARERIRFLSRVLEKAVDEEYLIVNPAAKVKLVAKSEKLNRLPFSVAEAHQIIEWLCAQGDEAHAEWARACMLAMMAGCRLRDAVTMPTECLRDGVLHYKAHKTGKVLAVPLVIEKYRASLESIGGPLFCPGLSEYFARTGKNLMSTQFTEMVSAAGVAQVYHTFEGSGRTVARKTFHSLRHTLRTSIVSGGGSDAQADLILGHSAGQGKQYTHSELDALKRALDNALNE